MDTVVVSFFITYGTTKMLTQPQLITQRPAQPIIQNAPFRVASATSSPNSLNKPILLNQIILQNSAYQQRFEALKHVFNELNIPLTENIAKNILSDNNIESYKNALMNTGKYELIQNGNQLLLRQKPVSYISEKSSTYDTDSSKKGRWIKYPDQISTYIPHELVFQDGKLIKEVTRQPYRSYVYSGDKERKIDRYGVYDSLYVDYKDNKPANIVKNDIAEIDYDRMKDMSASSHQYNPYISKSFDLKSGQISSFPAPSRNIQWSGKSNKEPIVTYNDQYLQQILGNEFNVTNLTELQKQNMLLDIQRQENRRKLGIYDTYIPEKKNYFVKDNNLYYNTIIDQNNVKIPDFQTEKQYNDFIAEYDKLYSEREKSLYDDYIKKNKQLIAKYRKDLRPLVERNIYNQLNKQYDFGNKVSIDLTKPENYRFNIWNKSFAGMNEALPEYRYQEKIQPFIMDWKNFHIPSLNIKITDPHSTIVDNKFIPKSEFVMDLQRNLYNVKSGNFDYMTWLYDTPEAISRLHSSWETQAHQESMKNTLKGDIKSTLLYAGALPLGIGYTIATAFRYPKQTISSFYEFVKSAIKDPLGTAVSMSKDFEKDPYFFTGEMIGLNKIMKPFSKVIRDRAGFERVDVKYREYKSNGKLGPIRTYSTWGIWYDLPYFGRNFIGYIEKVPYIRFVDVTGKRWGIKIDKKGRWISKLLMNQERLNEIILKKYHEKLLQNKEKQGKTYIEIKENKSRNYDIDQYKKNIDLLVKKFTINGELTKDMKFIKDLAKKSIVTEKTFLPEKIPYPELYNKRFMQREYYYKIHPFGLQANMMEVPLYNVKPIDWIPDSIGKWRLLENNLKKQFKTEKGRRLVREFLNDLERQIRYTRAVREAYKPDKWNMDVKRIHINDINDVLKFAKKIKAKLYGKFVSQTRISKKTQKEYFDKGTSDIDMMTDMHPYQVWVQAKNLVNRLNLKRNGIYRLNEENGLKIESFDGTEWDTAVDISGSDFAIGDPIPERAFGYPMLDQFSKIQGIPSATLKTQQRAKSSSLSSFRELDLSKVPIEQQELYSNLFTENRYGRKVGFAPRGKRGIKDIPSYFADSQGMIDNIGFKKKIGDEWIHNKLDPSQILNKYALEKNLEKLKKYYSKEQIYYFKEKAKNKELLQDFSKKDELFKKADVYTYPDIYSKFKSAYIPDFTTGYNNMTSYNKYLKPISAYNLNYPKINGSYILPYIPTLKYKYTPSYKYSYSYPKGYSYNKGYTYSYPNYGYNPPYIIEKPIKKKNSSYSEQTDEQSFRPIILDKQNKLKLDLGTFPTYEDAKNMADLYIEQNPDDKYIIQTELQKAQQKSKAIKRPFTTRYIKGTYVANRNIQSIVKDKSKGSFDWMAMMNS